MGTLPEKYRFPLILSLIILGAVCLLSYRIDEPFAGGYQGYSTIYNIIARNYLRYGYLATKFGWVINSGIAVPEEFIYYTRHPPLFGIILSIGLRIFGEHNWSARMVMILFSIFNIILIFLITEELWNKPIAISASFFASFSPVFLLYGSHIDHVGSVVLFFMFAVFWFYVLWEKCKKNHYFFTMCLFFFLGALTAWPVYFLFPFLLIHGLLTKRPKIIWFLPLIAVLCFVSFFFYIYLLTGNWLGCQIKEMFLYRTGISKIHPQWTEIGYPIPSCNGLSFTVPEFFVKFLYKMIVLFSPVSVFLSSVWLANFIARMIRKREIRNDLLLSVFLFGCGSYCLAFPNITFQHEYVLFCIWGPVAVSSALGFNIIKNLSIPKTIRQISCIAVCILFAAQSIVVSYEKHRRRIAVGLWEYTLGKTIGKYVLPGEEVITNTKVSFAARYYADRFIRFEVRDMDNFVNLKNAPSRNYKYFIVKKDATIEPELMVYLKNNYSSCVEGDLILFKIH